MYLNAILPRDARVVGYKVGGATRRPQIESEAGFPVVWDQVVLRAGESEEVRVEYYLRGAFDPDVGVFEMTLYPHAAAHPDRAEVTITSRDGDRVSVLGIASGEGQVVIERTLDRELHLQVVLEP